MCVCVCACVSCHVCLSASPSRCLAVCLGSFVSFCLCLSRQPPASPLVWPWTLTGAMALAEELAPGGCLPGRGCVRVSVCLSVCLPVARLLSQEGGVLGGRPGGKGVWPREGEGAGLRRSGQPRLRGSWHVWAPGRCQAGWSLRAPAGLHLVPQEAPRPAGHAGGRRPGRQPDTSGTAWP